MDIEAKRLTIFIFLISVTSILSISSHAYECDNWQAKHPDWLWCDDFESSSTSDYDGGWRDYITYVDKQASSDDVYSGNRAIQATITPGVNSAAGIYKYFTGQDGSVFARWYAKFDQDYDDQGHEHFVTLQGLDTSKPCGCSGCCANTRPIGDDRFLTGLEFDDKGTYLESRLYSYFYNQRNPSSAYRCCPKPLSTWAQDYRPAVPVTVDKGSWHSMELEIHPNTPGSDDGYVAYWIDGVLAMNATHSREACGPYTSSYTTECEDDDPSVDVYRDVYDNPPPYPAVYPAEGFIWRTTSSLKLNNIWIQVFNHEATTNPGINRVWFDSLVVGKHYIGPAACAENGKIDGACYCGGKPSPDDSSNIYTDGYCCNAEWQGSECSIAEYYVDPDYSGSTMDGSMSRPWNRLDASAWSTINSALAGDDVTVYVSARDATSDTGEDYGGGITVKRTDKSSHRLTLDGMSKYNTNDANPSWTDNSGDSMAKLVDAGGHALGWNRDDGAMDYVTLRGFEVSGRQGRVTFGGNHLIIEQIYAHDVTEIGPSFHLFYGYDTNPGCNIDTGIFNDITIRNNTVEDSYGEALYIGGTQNWENGCEQNSHSGIKIYGNTIRNAGIYGAEGDAIDVKDGLTNVEIYDNRIDNPQETGIHVYGVYSGTGSENLRIHDNIISNTKGRSIILTASPADNRRIRGAEVFNNIIYGSDDVGISLSSTGTGIYDVDIYKNTIYNNQQGIDIGSSSGITVRDNLVFRNQGTQLSTWGSSDIDSDFNAYADGDTWGFSPEGTHTLHDSADSLVIDATGDDFRPVDGSVLCGNGENNADIGALTCSGSVPSCGSIDTDSSGTIENDELLAHINSWYNGSGITTIQLLDAIRKWKNGC